MEKLNLKQNFTQKIDYFARSVSCFLWKLMVLLSIFHSKLLGSFGVVEREHLSKSLRIPDQICFNLF